MNIYIYIYMIFFTSNIYNLLRYEIAKEVSYVLHMGICIEIPNPSARFLITCVYYKCGLVGFLSIYAYMRYFIPKALKSPAFELNSPPKQLISPTGRQLGKSPSKHKHRDRSKASIAFFSMVLLCSFLFSR